MVVIRQEIPTKKGPSERFINHGIAVIGEIRADTQRRIKNIESRIGNLYVYSVYKAFLVEQ